MTTPRTSTAHLIDALRILSRDIQSPDGVANAAIAEAADRLEELAACREALVGVAGSDSAAELRGMRDGFARVANADNEVPLLVAAIDALLPGASTP